MPMSAKDLVREERMFDSLSSFCFVTSSRFPCCTRTMCPWNAKSERKKRRNVHARYTLQVKNACSRLHAHLAHPEGRKTN